MNRNVLFVLELLSLMLVVYCSVITQRPDRYCEYMVNNTVVTDNCNSIEGYVK